MNTLLLINSNIDDHSGWLTPNFAKTRVADQTGNFILNGKIKYDETDYKFTKGSTNTGSSLIFDGSNYIDMNDWYLAFNFNVMPLSIDTWVKFDSSATESRKHTILAKWSDDIALGQEKIFRLFYEHNAESPDQSRMVFERCGIKGYPNEKFPILRLSSHSTDYDGEYIYDEDINLPRKLKNYKAWRSENGMLLVPIFRDPVEMDDIKKTTENYIKNSFFVDAWYYDMGNPIVAKSDDACTSCWKLMGTRLKLPELPSESKSTLVNAMAFELEARTEYRVSFVYEGSSDFSAKVYKNPNYMGEVSGELVFSCGTHPEEKNKIIQGANSFMFACDETTDYGIVFEAHGNDDSANSFFTAPAIRRTKELVELDEEVGSVFLAKKKTSNSLDFDNLENVTLDVVSGKHEYFTCGNLLDDAWHYLYFSSTYDPDSVDVSDETSLFDFGVDDQFHRIEDVFDEDTPTITYLDNSDNTPDREMYISSAQPYFEKAMDVAYANKVKLQKVYVGASELGGYLKGKIDTLRVHPTCLYDEKEDYDNRSMEQPHVIISSWDLENVCKYDSHTKYQIFKNENPIMIKEVEPTYADVETPTTPYELYKKYLGSREFMESRWMPSRKPSDKELDTWRWELKFINLPMWLSMTYEGMAATKQYTDKLRVEE